MNLYNLADQTLAADAHHIGHIGIPHALRDYQRPGDLLNYASAHLYLLLTAEYNIGAHCLLHGLLHSRHTAPRIAGRAGNQDDRRKPR